MGNRISFVFLLFIGSIPFSLINYLPAFKGNLPEPLHIVTSVIAVLLLLLVGLFMGYYNQRYFVRWYTAYWFLGALLLSLGYVMKSFILLIPTVLLYAAPFYGLRFFF
ncbi:hypothetical protein [Paenibacillus sp. DMB20]|uniref:hypothetical protein n=1 Tax=Paenibacillus sp. DMB20 TaxID=1642570 RepID=UPI0006275980|nr:hypothetical protein [Paenibacillus sp. DMB20]KKO52650.1 hypothetical protein XI25_18555 [Paenibacillus sp. DMB20]